MSHKKNKLAENMNDFFDLRVEGYDSHMRENVDCFEEFYNTISNVITETDTEISVLDIGCGTGLELEGIFNKAPNALVTGIDLSDGMLKKLLEKYKEFKAKITTINDSYTTYELVNNKYDYAISVMTVHHLLEDEKVKLYKKIRNSLKDGGKYIEGDYVVKKKEAKEALNEYEKIIKTLDENEYYHIDIPMTEKTQIDLLKQAGFSQVEVIFKAERNRVFVAYK